MKISKLLVYLESKRSREFVGTLIRTNDGYEFIYDEKYFYSESPIQVGPDLPLKKNIS